MLGMRIKMSAATNGQASWLLHWTTALLLVAGGCQLLQAQTPTPVPDELLAWAWGHSNADVIVLPTQNPQHYVQAEVRFYNADGDPRVELSWRFKTANGSGRKTSTHDVSFQPTGVCGRAGSTDVIYVVGWSSRASKVLVEEWRLTNFALAETITPSGKTIVSLAGPTVDRTLLTATDEIPLVAGVAANPWSDQLYLLDNATPRAVHVLDIATGDLAPTPLVTETQQPALAEHRSILAGLTDQGFVVFTEERRRWVRHGVSSLPQTVVSLRDEGLDGVFEIVQAVPVDVFNATWVNRWVLDFSEP